MAINLMEAVQTKLGYPPMTRISPNTQEEKGSEGGEHHTRGQAILTSVAIGIYKYSRHEETANKIASGNNSSKWVDDIFGETKDEVVARVAAYEGISAAEAEAEMNRAAHEAVNILNERIGEDKDGGDMRTFLTTQRASILMFLPPSLRLGEALNDEAIDERTNKMEGPMSNLMAGLGQVFTDSRPEE